MSLLLLLIRTFTQHKLDCELIGLSFSFELKVIVDIANYLCGVFTAYH
ncbi:hypothetical protein VCR15J2_470837 [Vibrio coralliirubri]|uniref:Uncharacterized protein n=1 Tax=Vibrio coralliirubri TaxID=1516159 RepID=A0AA86WSQ2_9VIBR|nr:hypothetical protein VCR31J2_1270829 [Vibrio coralliirubri]CDT71003.1 hypothetical protein VCR15J2_470837 [Vibrio coralliirubri]